MKSMIYPNTIKEHDICTIGADTLDDLKFPIALDGIAYYISKNTETILYRQELFKNILAFPEIYELFAEIYVALTDLKEISLKNPESSATDNEQLLYSMRELCIFTDLVNKISERYDALISKITADGLTGFFEFVKSVQESEDFTYTSERLKLVDEGMKSIKSITLGVNLNAQLSASEVGIVSINSQPYVADTTLDRIMRKENPQKEFRCIAPVGVRETGGLTQRNAMSFDTAFYGAMNQVLRHSIRNMKQLFSKMIFTSIASLLNYIPEIEFILKASEYMLSLKKSGMKIVFPDISEKYEAVSLSNPNLLDKIPLRNIVPSNTVFDENGRIFILTGPNSGGKSVYLQAVGIAQIMFQMGLPVASESASYTICDSILTHFNKSTANTIESRLVNETKRFKEILDRTTDGTLLLFDEMLSSTSAYDATILAGGILKHIQKIGCKCIYATHLHELAMNCQSLNDDRSKAKIDVLSSRIENGMRNYEIKRGKTDNINTSFAKDIFIEYGIDFIFE